MNNQQGEFEQLKKQYILQTSLLLKTLEELQLEDLRKSSVKAQIALQQADSATCFMELCKFILTVA